MGLIMGRLEGPQMGKGMDQDCLGGKNVRKGRDKELKGAACKHVAGEHVCWVMPCT